jgi:hypothetical protein
MIVTVSLDLPKRRSARILTSPRVTVSPAIDHPIGHATGTLTAPEAAVAGWRICALASRDAAVAVLTAKIVPHMFRIMLTGVLPRTPVLLIIPARGQAGWRTCHRSFNGI